MTFVFLFIIFLFMFWLWAIIHCLKSNLTSAQKLFWVIIIIFFCIVGALLYFIFSKSISGGKTKSKKFKGKKLFRIRKNRMIAGVCAGFGNYLGVDPTVIRLLWVAATLITRGAGILAYIIAWIIVPEEK